MNVGLESNDKKIIIGGKEAWGYGRHYKLSRNILNIVAENFEKEEFLIEE